MVKSLVKSRLGHHGQVIPRMQQDQLGAVTAPETTVIEILLDEKRIMAGERRNSVEISQFRDFCLDFL